MANFQGRWKLVGTEGFDEYMKALGVGAIQRTIGNATKPVQTITVNGAQITINISSMVNTAEISFTLGQEFDETTGDGRACKTTVTLEGDNKLVQSQKGSVDSVLTRELPDPNTMVMTLVAKDAKAVRTYKRE